VTPAGRGPRTVTTGTERSGAGALRAFGVFVVAAAVGGLIWAGVASAEAIYVRIKGDREFVLMTPTIATESCKSGGLHVVKLVQEPQHGKFVVRKTMNEMPPNAVNSTRCTGRKIAGLTLSYVPDKGFRGKDELAFTVTVMDRREHKLGYEMHFLVE